MQKLRRLAWVRFAFTDGAARRASSTAAAAPFLVPKPRTLECSGFKWIDEYSWLQHDPREAPRLAQEEARHFRRWARKVGADSLTAQLRDEVLSALPSQTSTPPEVLGNYEYFVEQTEERPLPCYLRRHVRDLGGSGGDQVVIDTNELAAALGDDISVEQIKLSKCGAKVAFTVAEGNPDAPHAAFIREIPTGRLWQQPAMQRVISIEWAADGRTLLFTVPDELGRPYKVLRTVSQCYTDSSFGLGGAMHAARTSALGSEAQVAEVVMEEADPKYFIELQRTKDWEFLAVNVNSKLSSEVHILPAIDPGSHPRCIQPRCEGLEYFLEHRQGHLYILSNAREAENYALYAAAVQNGSLREESWQVVVPQRPDIALEDLDVFSHGVVLHERHRGRPQIRVMPAAPGAVPSLESSYLLPLPEWAVAVAAGANADFDSVKLRVELSSPVHPDRPFDWDIARKAWEPLPGPALTGHNPEDFTCHQVWALGHKGTCTGPSNGTGGVPLTLVHAKHVTLDGSAPCLVVVYGAYGHNLPVDFLPERLPLLRRGWVVALVHARGGGELGRRWHAAGRGTAKRATATDVETAIHYLVAHGYSSKGKFALEGSSAGGVAAGAVLNRHPSFFAAALLESPFVDVLSTLCDPTLPLTQHEYDEFGHPGSAEGVRHLHSICPYQGIVPGQMYPPVLVTCSQSDHRVPSWGPLKYAARLRAAQGGVGGGAAAGRVLVLPDAHEGHLAGDRERYDVKAAQYAFVLKAMELRDRPEAW